MLFRCAAPTEGGSATGQVVTAGILLAAGRQWGVSVGREGGAGVIRVAVTVLVLALWGDSPARAGREWYVMAPPAATGPTDERWREDGLAQWERWAVADSAAECHRMVTALRALAGKAGREPETPVPDWVRDTPWVQSASARCVASDDPRLAR